MVEPRSRAEGWRPVLPLCLGWSSVFLANLVAPVSLGMSCTEAGGRLGMWLGVLAWWAAGLVVCVRRPELGRLLSTGGVAIAFSQLLPVLQVAAGFAALWCADPSGIVNDRGLAELYGFVATALTGGELLAGALVCGWMARGFDRWVGQPREQTTPDGTRAAGPAAGQ